MQEGNPVEADAQRDDKGSLRGRSDLGLRSRGIEELRAAVAGMTGDQLRSRPIPGKWSTLEVVCHVADGEQFFADRMKRTVAMDRPLLIGADGFRYPEPLHYQELDELDLVAVTRRQNGSHPPAWSPPTPGSAPPSTAKSAW